jgi:hypothetical protein
MSDASLEIFDIAGFTARVGALEASVRAEQDNYDRARAETVPAARLDAALTVESSVWDLLLLSTDIASTRDLLVERGTPDIDQVLADFNSTASIRDLVRLREDLRALIVSASEQVQATSGGDPYIFPVDGPHVKLPNTPERYRMYQHRLAGVYVDARV